MQERKHKCCAEGKQGNSYVDSGRWMSLNVASMPSPSFN